VKIEDPALGRIRLGLLVSRIVGATSCGVQMSRGVFVTRKKRAQAMESRLRSMDYRLFGVLSVRCDQVWRVCHRWREKPL
jgi:hypothetical protein